MHNAHHHEPFPVEEEQPDNSRLALYGVVIAVTFFTCGIVLTTIFHRANALMEVQRGSEPTEQMSTLRAKEKDRLTNYAWVEKDKTVRIPIERAMQLVVEESQKK